MLPAGLVGHVRLRYLGTSAQKTRLVVDLIRGRSVDEAIATLRYTHKVVAREIGRALDSAVANARQRKPEIDVDRLFVHTAFVDGGPSLKRIRPAPMGRAFRVQKRMCHVTIGLGETRVHRPAPAARKAAPASESAPGAAETAATTAGAATEPGAAPATKRAGAGGAAAKGGGKTHAAKKTARPGGHKPRSGKKQS
jgi:large subunit ribosomal protein L22